MCASSLGVHRLLQGIKRSRSKNNSGDNKEPCIQNVFKTYENLAHSMCLWWWQTDKIEKKNEKKNFFQKKIEKKNLIKK